MISDEELIERFKHHPPTADQIIEAHDMIREEFKDLALKMNDTIPEGREKSLMFTKLEEAMFWANGAVARTQRVGP